MGPFILAWLVGEGIIVFRTMRDGKKATGHYVPPGPGQLVWSSGLFVKFPRVMSTITRVLGSA